MPNLPVGNELNLLLQEHVIGYQWKESPYRDYASWAEWWRKPQLMPPGEEWAMKETTNYLTGDGMLKVIATMHELGWSFALFKGSGDDVFYAEFTKHIEGRKYSHIQEWHNDAPTATGQAALQAMRIL